MSVEVTVKEQPGFPDALSLECWQHLKVQLSPYNSVIAIEEQEFDGWTRETRDSIHHLFM